MNFKILSIMIVLVCIHGQVWSSNTPLLSKKNMLNQKLYERMPYLAKGFEYVLIEFGRALDQDEYDYALEVITFSFVPRGVSESRELERKISIKLAHLSLSLIDETSKEKKEEMQQNQERLKVLSAFVNKQKERAKEESCLCC